MKTIQKNAKIQQQGKHIKRAYLWIAMVVALCLFMATPALAATSTPIESINKLSDFVFAAIKAVGVIILGLGIVQLGLSLKSHDASQRANGVITILGGVIIAFAKDILDLIM